jgi:DNA repair protein RadC
MTLVRENEAPYPRTDISEPAAVAKLVTPFVAAAVVEHFLVLLMNTKNRLIGSVEVSRGDLNSATVHPREVFAPAIVARAAYIIAVHNHPSGDPKPSQRDVEVTMRLREAGELLGIKLLDHIIVTEQGSFYSFQSHGFLAPRPNLAEACA